MMNLQKKQQVVKNLIHDTKQKGYISIDDIIKAIDLVDLPIDDVDRICDILSNKGIIICDSDDSKLDIEQNQKGYLSCRSKIDYDKIFLKAVDIDESLESYISNLKHIAPPRIGEEQELIYRARAGNAYARNRLINMHLKVVVRIALSYVDKYNFPLADTIQDGNLGLIVALNKIPLTPEYRYSSYAPWWIRQTIIRYNNTFCNKYYVPVHLKEKLYQTFDLINTHNCVECYQSKYYCKNLIQEIADNISDTTEKATYFLYLLEEPISINEVLEENNEALFSDNDMFINMFIDKLAHEECKAIFENMLNKLKIRDKEIVRERFGLNNSNPKTLEEIGNSLNLTRERIRQIEKKVMSRLMNPKYVNILRDFY